MGRPKKNVSKKRKAKVITKSTTIKKENNVFAEDIVMSPVEAAVKSQVKSIMEKEFRPVILSILKDKDSFKSLVGVQLESSVRSHIDSIVDKIFTEEFSEEVGTAVERAAKEAVENLQLDDTDIADSVKEMLVDSIGNYEPCHVTEDLDAKLTEAISGLKITLT
jgi:hypothetical protein